MNTFFARIISSLIINKKKRGLVRKILMTNDSYLNSPVADQTAWDIFSYISASNLHRETFGKYKNYFKDSDIAVCGSGPSFKNYQPLNNTIHIGTNLIFLDKKINFDFLFWQDFMGLKEITQEIISYECTKFIGCFTHHRYGFQVPQSLFNQLKDAHQYIIEPASTRIPFDIGAQPLYHGGSTIYSAFQFALWTNPKRIFLIGCDSAGASDPLHWHHFYDTTPTNSTPIQPLINGWRKLKRFATDAYPDVEIISINPVGLKGIFTDIYQ